MLEAISVILAMAMLAAMVAAIVGVVQGFRRKQWRLAIITGSIFGALFIVVTIFMGATGQLDDLETEPDEPTQAILPTAAPIPESSPIPVGGLGITRDEIHSFLEYFEYRNVREESCPGIICTSVESPNPNVKIWLYGPDNELDMAMVNGDNRDNDSDTGAAMAHLINIVMSESADTAVNWILTDAVESLDRKGGGGLERAVIGDKEVILGLSSRSGGLTLTVKSLN